jgi:hypothetical protein
MTTLFFVANFDKKRSGKDQMRNLMGWDVVKKLGLQIKIRSGEIKHNNNSVGQEGKD